MKTSRQCDVTFQSLKQILSQAPVLAYPTSEGAFVLDTDGSNTRIRAVLLSQKEREDEKVIVCSLTKTERQCCLIRKELLFLVTAVRYFHHYVYGRHFKVRTDHGALRWLMNPDEAEGKLDRDSGHIWLKSWAPPRAKPWKCKWPFPMSLRQMQTFWTQRVKGMLGSENQKEETRLVGSWFSPTV